MIIKRVTLSKYVECGRKKKKNRTKKNSTRTMMDDIEFNLRLIIGPSRIFLLPSVLPLSISM